MDGDRAVRVNDPAVPTEREVSLGMPTAGGPGPVGDRAARSDREARAARRARSAWQARPRRPPEEEEEAGRPPCGLRRVQARPEARDRGGGRPAALADLVRPVPPHLQEAARGPQGAARLCDRLGRGACAVEAAGRVAHAGGVRPARAKPALLALASLPGRRRPGQLQGERDPLPVLPRRGTPAPSALDLQEGEPHVRRLPERVAELRRSGPPAPARRDDRARGATDSRTFVAWEYAFHFGGGSPPWISGLSQGTALQAYARAGVLLAEPSYVETARAGLGAFEAGPPRGRAHRRSPRRRALPRVLVRAAPLHLQRIPAGADRAARLRQADRGGAGDGAFPAGRARGARRGAAVRRRRLVALLVPRRRVVERLPRAAARVSGLDVLAPPGAALLRLRRAIPRLSGGPARADLHGSRGRGRGRAHGDPLRAVEAVGGRGEGDARLEGRLLEGRHLPRAAPGRSRSAPARPARSPCSWRPRSCAPGSARRTGPRANWTCSRRGRARIGASWRLAPSCTPERAASGRRASPPRPHAAARPPVSARWCSRPTPPTACRTRSRPSSAPSPRRPGRTCSGRRCRPRRRWSATGTRCRAGSARCSRSAGSTGFPPRS